MVIPRKTTPEPLLWHSKNNFTTNDKQIMFPDPNFQCQIPALNQLKANMNVSTRFEDWFVKIEINVSDWDDFKICIIWISQKKVCCTEDWFVKRGYCCSIPWQCRVPETSLWPRCTFGKRCSAGGRQCTVLWHGDLLSQVQGLWVPWQKVPSKKSGQIFKIPSDQSSIPKLAGIISDLQRIEHVDLPSTKVPGNTIGFCSYKI